MTDENFQCEKTFAALSKRKDADIVIEHERKRRGCGVITEEPKITLDDHHIAFHSCLCHENFQYPLMDQILFLHDKYNKGILPYEGSLTDQPNKIIEIFQLIDQLHQEREQQQAKKQQDKK